LILNTDHVVSNVGLRGVSGGVRSGGRHLKVLLNGQPIAFRPDAQNLIGPELLPIDAIERIEIIRGPASALYGLNAFLGVVSIVTRDAISSSGRGRLKLGGGLINGRLAGEAEQSLTYADDFWDVLLAARLVREDRSGLRLPAGSPRLDDYAGNDSGQRDLNRPTSLFARAAYATRKLGTFTLQSRFSELNASGEYVDTGALSHVTNVHLQHWSVLAEHFLEKGKFQLRTTTAYEAGRPGEEDLTLPMINGQPVGQTVTRRFRFNAFTARVEPSYRWSRSRATVGVEADWDYEQLRQNVFTVRGTEQQTLGRRFAPIRIENYGVYAQVMVNEIDRLGLTANLRYDTNNLFADNFNYRAGLVWSATEALYLKLLSGSSYRAPSVEQLYGTPVVPGGVEGALVSSSPVPLRPQTALTHELVLGYGTSTASLTLAGFLSDVADRIEYVNDEGNLRPANLFGSRTLGSELSGQALWSFDALDRIDLRLNGGLALQTTRFSFRDDALTPREQEQLSVNELVPTLSGNLVADLEVARYRVGLNLRVSAYGARPESQINQSIGRLFVGDPVRTLPPSFPVDLTLSSRDLRVIPRLGETRFSFQIYDLLGTQSPEPGFNGLNIPALGRRFFASVEQSF
jgi:outer membrane receptor for ferrienterochelin and colicins